MLSNNSHHAHRAALDARLRLALDERAAAGLLRSRLTVEGPQGPRILVDGRRYLSFCSNDYLGLANDPRVVEALREGAARYGAGSGASHLVTGHARPHEALEEALAEFTGRERALVFSTGYMANLGIVCALLGRGDLVVADRLNHASLVDAALLSRARHRRYTHADPAAAAKALGSHPEAAGKLVLTDGVFSMDGDLAPLPALADHCRTHDAWFMVDDAHGLGVLGTNGRGTLEHFALDTADVPILMGTLGKALGTFGAFVAGSQALIDTLVQHARPYIYTTALPPAVAEATRASIAIVRAEPWRREHLQKLTERFRRGAQALEFPMMPAPGPIQPLILGDSARAVAASRALAQRGIQVVAIRPPTVPRNSARLRITLSAAHTEEDVDQLLDALSQVLP